MSNGSGSRRLLFTIATFIAGVAFGAALGAFLAYVVLPANLVLRDAPPLYLRADLTGATVEYRDLFVARVAQRYALGAQSGTADPAFIEAQESLGVASGDASPADALSMANSALQSASQENLRDGANPDAGRFTLADENNIKQLADRLTQIQGQPAVVPESVVAAQRADIIKWGALLFVFGLILVGVLFALNALFGRGNSTVTTTKTTTTTLKTHPMVAEDGVSVTQMQPASADELPDVLIDVKTPPPTEAGFGASPSSSNVAAMAGAVTMQQHAASPVAGESLISTFHAAYLHGEDGYTEIFQIHSTSGALIGECGAAIVERFGVDKQARVTAFDIWVFDKKDFNSKHTILMTPFAFRDPVIYEKLKKQGDPVQVRLGVFEVLTSTLRAEVEVRNLLMQPINDDPDGYFERVDLEFRILKRLL